jgi:murein DD-endopeptidase MepM/ murein hydrolase activator NlpD
VYVVQSGDSPAKIAKKEGVKTADLMKLNNITDPRSLRVGQKLKLPTGATTAAASTLSSPTAPTEPTTTAPESSNTTIAPMPDTTAAPEPSNTTAAPPAGNSTVEENVPVTPVTPSN